MAYGDPIYSQGGRDSPSQLIGREGMIPTYSGSSREGNLSVSFQDDPNYQKSPQLSSFLQKVASGEIQGSGTYGQKTREGYDFSSGSKQSAYTSYDPKTNQVTFYDTEGNVTQQGQRTASGGGLISGLEQFTQDPSKALTNALQPVEKTINYIGAHPEMQLAIAMAVAVPVVGEYIGAELMAAGVVTSAEAASAAAIAQGATAAQAAAAAQAATATATTIGIAIASTSAQVAQGVPLEQAIQNTAADVAVSQLSPAAAKQLDGLLNSPAVTDAITSTVASGAATAARGGSQEEVEKAMTAGLAGSAASSAYKSVAKSAPDIYSKTIGGATAGAVKGGTEGAVIGGLSSAAGSLGRPSSTTNLAADTGGADLEPYVDPSTSGEPAKLDPRLTPLEDGTGWRDKSGNIYSKNDFAVNADDGTLVARVNVSGVGDSGKKEPVYLGELPEVTITGTRQKEYTPEITLPSGYKIPRVDVYGSNQPSRTDFTPPPSLAEPGVPTEEPIAEEPPAEEAPADKPKTYKPDIFVTTYKKPKSGSSMAALGAALGTAGTTTGLTSERGAGEIEGTGTGGKRKKVWNEASLKLKDALGV